MDNEGNDMTTIQDYLDKENSTAKNILQLLMVKKTVIRQDFAEHLPGVSVKAINATVATLRRNRIIYVSGWEKSPKLRPRAKFSIGDQPDEFAPISRQYQERKVTKEEKITQTIGARYDAINRALVPARNMTQQRVANLRYLNHIQGIR
jgi:predicted ArsR family transcriptional regulator